MPWIANDTIHKFLSFINQSSVSLTLALWPIHESDSLPVGKEDMTHPLTEANCIPSVKPKWRSLQRQFPHFSIWFSQNMGALGKNGTYIASLNSHIRMYTHQISFFDILMIFFEDDQHCVTSWHLDVATMRYLTHTHPIYIDKHALTHQWYIMHFHEIHVVVTVAMSWSINIPQPSLTSRHTLLMPIFNTPHTYIYIYIYRLKILPTKLDEGIH